MISTLLLERPGRWRGIVVIAGICIVAAPAVTLFSRTALWPTSGVGLGPGFEAAVGRSLMVAAGTAGIALALGMPCGVLAGLYRFPARRWLLAALALPLLVPAFLWSVGLSMLRIALGLGRDNLLSGLPGVLWSFAALGTPLVVFAALVTIGLLPSSAVDAARVAGGERAVLRYTSRAALPPALAAALLSGLVTLADPGPGQILGYSGVATQILTSFAALYDFELAARQGLAAAVIVLAAAAPVVWLAARQLVLALQARDWQMVRPRTHAWARFAGPAVLLLVLCITLLAPVVGLAAPIADGFWMDSIRTAVARTAGNTLYYGVGAGLVATAWALPLALAAARAGVLRAVLLAALGLVIVLPAAVGSLGVVLLAGDAPAWLDPILRSRFTVAVVLGTHLTAIAAVVLLRAIGSVSPSWAAAAAVHGVGLASYSRRVLAPFLVRPILMSIALVALVATADITTVLLLQPPGRDSLPVALFTVMANSPESMVASLCIAYLLLGGAVIASITVAASALERRP